MTDRPSPDVILPAPAVYDTDDPVVTPDDPRHGHLSLAPYQALMLAASPDLPQPEGASSEPPPASTGA